jgi:hypothetical protein
LVSQPLTLLHVSGDSRKQLIECVSIACTLD